MKILQVCPLYYPQIGGVESHIYNINRYLTKAGFDVEVYTTEPSIKVTKQEVIDGISVTRFPAIAPNRTIYFSYPLYRALKRVNVDIVHAHNYRALTMLFAALARNQNASLVVTTHLGFSKVGKWIYHIYDPLFGRKIFDRADRIIIVSPSEVHELPILTKYSHKTICIPNGVDFPQIDKHYLVDRQAKPIVDLLCVSRIEQRKGVEIAIRAIGYLGELPIHLNIIGDGPDMDRLKSLVNELKLGQTITFVGKINLEDLYAVYSQSDVFLLLSEYEAHSVALTEAMAFGLVPIVTRVGGNPYIVDSETGYVLDYPVDAQTVAAIIRQLVNERELIRQKGAAARSKAVKQFNIAGTVKKILEIYQAMI